MTPALAGDREEHLRRRRDGRSVARLEIWSMNYIFGDYTLDDTRYELWWSGESVAIEPKAFKVLAHLLQHRDRVVTKTELIERFWSGAFVSESALTRCLARVRRAVHDEGPEQRIIKTIRGHGYRFVAALATRGAEPAHPAIPGTSRLRTVVDGQQTPPLRGPTLPCPQCQTVNKAERLFARRVGRRWPVRVPSVASATILAIGSAAAVGTIVLR